MYQKPTIFNVIKKTKRYDTIPTKNITDTEAHVDQNQDSKIGGESNIFYKFRLAFWNFKKCLIAGHGTWRVTRVWHESKPHQGLNYWISIGKV